MKDTDYLSISARVRAMENRLLTRERRERMIEARSDEEVSKILEECGYGPCEELSPAAVNRALAQAREDLFQELKGTVPQRELVEVFQIKYDYHNGKVLLKAQALQEEAGRLLMSGGRWSQDKLAEDFQRGELTNYPPAFRQAMAAAEEALTQGKDPRKADLLLDKACYAEMAQAAQASGSPFLQGYVALSIDAVNLRTAVRWARLGGESEGLGEFLLPGGRVEPGAIQNARGAELAKAFASSPLEKAAQLGGALTAAGSGSLTPFERACDDVLTAYLAQARRIPFGEQPVVGYLCAREAEATAIRTILAGRQAGQSAEAIRERLGECYG